MCGVVAIARPAGLHHDERVETLHRMRDALAHRGPDDATSAVVDDWVALGHRRLSILDLAGSRQPLVDESGDVVCIFNGEIYNFRELRARLEALGHRFATRGDGEVIVHGYEQWGEGVAERLEGMFSFVLVDRARARLVAARDRFGIKPLFWTEAGGALLIASELKALLAHPSVPRVADRFALNVGVMRLHVPWPLTAFHRVWRLPPGALLTVEKSGGPRLRRFAPMLDEAPVRARPAAELVEEAELALRRSVERQMVADVPVGAFLSGGIDSTLVVALMARIARHPIHTFSVSTGPGDESEIARATARTLGTEHHTVALGELPFDELTVLASLYDEPFAETSALGVRALSLAARKHVAVALTGDGGDEVFGGYDTYRYIRNVSRATSVLPTRLAPPVRAWATARLRDRAWPTMLRRGLRALSIWGESPRVAQRSLVRWEPRVPERIAADSLALTARVEAAACPSLLQLQPGRQAMLADRLERLPGAMLTKVDVASMSASLEVRVPLLDDALVRFADGVDETELIGVTRGKLLLRRVLADLLPGRLATAPKRGFTLPVDGWMRRAATRDRLASLFTDEQERCVRLTGLDMVERHRTFDRAPRREPQLVTSDEVLWLAMVALWARRFGVDEALDSDPSAAPLA